MMIHTLGLTEFMTRFEIHPVYLNNEELIRIGIMNGKQIKELDEQFKFEGGEANV